MATQNKTNEEIQQQLNSARQRRTSCQNAISQMQSTVSANSEKISRLKTAKSQMETIESEAQGKSISFRNFLQNSDNFGKWQGNKYASVQAELVVTTGPQYGTYAANITSLISQIAAKITQLENENFHLANSIIAKTTEFNQLNQQIMTLSQGGI